MKLKHNHFLLICLFFSTIIAKAQDPHFTQWHANYNQLNPALTGISNNPHLNYTFRNQWPSISGGGFVTNVLSYDQRISPKAGFIGLAFMDDMAGDASLQTSSTNVNYAYNFQLSEDVNLRVGTAIGFFQRSIDFSKLKFGDMIDPRQGFVKETKEKLPNASGIGTTGPKANFALGSVISHKNLYAGIGVYNLLEPEMSFFGNPVSVLPKRFSAQLGAFIPFDKDDEKSLVFAPYAVVQSQAKFAEVVSGLNLNKGIFTAGFSVRQTDPNIDAVNFLFGISKGWFKGGYSYDYTVSDARSAAKGSHELSLSFYFGKTREGNDKGLPYYFRKMGF